MSRSFEKAIASYGYWVEGVFMTKVAAQKFAEQMIGSTVDGSPLAPARQFRIIDTWLEDDFDDPGKGKVIATCQEIGRPGPQEVK